MKANMLKLNEDKTEFLIIQSSRRHLNTEGVKLKVGDALVSPSPSAKNLGVTFTDNLNMEKHVGMICRSANYHLRNIAKIRPFLDTSATEKIIHALITCRLDMSNSLLIGAPKYLINMLQRVQNNAARVLFRLPKYVSVSHLIREAHWLPVQSRIQYKLLLLTYNALNNIGPSYVKDLLEPYQPARMLRSQNMNMLVKPVPRQVSLGGRAFYVQAPGAWNDLPLELKTKQTVSAFKKGLKTFLFQQ
jgi:hypothetical protein